MVKLNTGLKLAASFGVAQTETDRRGIAGFQPVGFRHLPNTNLWGANGDQDIERSILRACAPSGGHDALTLELSFKPQAAGRTFQVEVLATGPEGFEQLEIEPAGTLTVTP